MSIRFHFLLVAGLTFLPLQVPAAPLIVDHASVYAFTNMTDADIARVKAMWVNIVGGSHASGYRTGCQLLESVDPRFRVNPTVSEAPESFSTNHLRITSVFRSAYNQWAFSGADEGYWFCAQESPVNPSSTIAYSTASGLNMSAMAFGWSWQPTWHNSPGGGIDPEYQVRWAGSSRGGPDGDLRWGLDDDSFMVTSNRVNMDTYLRATQSYVDFCNTNGHGTKVFFTTGPPDGDGGNGESAYQRHLKYEHIRKFVKASKDAALLDFADVLCHNEEGELNTVTWTDHGGTLREVSQMHPDNLLNFDGSNGSSRSSHMGERGELRLAKALWYLLAEISRPSPPALERVKTQGGTLNLRFTAQPHAAYSLQSSSDLNQASWHTLTNIPVRDIPQVVEITEPLTNSQAFYRVEAR